MNSFKKPLKSSKQTYIYNPSQNPPNSWISKDFPKACSAAARDEMIIVFSGELTEVHDENQHKNWDI